MFETNDIMCYVTEKVADGTKRGLLYEHVTFETGSLNCQRIIL
jgi:hypothetical protein